MKLLIPIKHESIRTASKNFRELGGEALWWRCLRRFSEFELFIDTDSEPLLEKIPKDFPDVTVYARPEHLRGHQVSVNKLLAHFVDEYCEDDEVVGQFHVTHPFLEPLTVRLAWDYLLKHIEGGAVAGATIHHTWFWNKDGPLDFAAVNHNPHELLRTQDLTPLYEDNSTYHLFTVKAFREGGNHRLGNNPVFLPVRPLESLDIDTEDDWTICQALYQFMEAQRKTPQPQYDQRDDWDGD